MSESKLMMVAGSSYIPKGIPERPRGDDADFFCPKAQVIGVADGAGSCRHYGIDAGEYARELMRNAAGLVENIPPAAVDPKSVLADAYAKTNKPGSTTACIISLAGDRLRAANIGDSGFVVIRGGKTIYRSPVQQYTFNCPCLLEVEWPKCLELVEEMAVKVEIGDVVVAGSDGLFDNMFPVDVEAVVEQGFSEGMSPEMVASELATVAHRRSLDRKTESPFAVESNKVGIPYFGGGKKDDITVVVARLIPLEGEVDEKEDCSCT